jgi:hypothetical protein
MQFNLGDRVKMISSNSTTEHVHEQIGTVIDVDVEHRVLRISTNSAIPLTLVVDSACTKLIKI